mmetsp:Transcript_27458/g.48939  ORF Transcript_27458/g.48939 Transcript_27458/m.48939 type:complete len:722 (-) Transcript_27458:112-2277(-)|eukprot:CAMPEP_0177761752 /NCGR_PEP_ID=MMETSP0491_2-20121128/5975_1 /TAXON_ID=63592 /ORGANISM="Tetraselmis chuii, Strain PLY429" /LENGTH=721 /DNA_ID=CAMNT_0019277753 /DNA_START=412 /DNA_END=2577 /DNA_ORIENTATION=+
MVRFAESTNVDPRATGPSFRSTAVEQSLASGKSSGNTAGRSYNSRTSKKSNSGKSKLKFQKPDHNLGIPSKARAQFAAQTSVRKATNKLKDTKRLTKPKLRQLKSYKDKAWLGGVAALLLGLLCLLLYSLMAEKPDQYLCTKADCTCIIGTSADGGTITCPEADTFAATDRILLGVAHYYIKPEKQDTTDPDHLLCYAVPNPDAVEELLTVEYQPIYADFDPVEYCVVEESLYYVLMTSRAFYWYFYVTGVVLLVSTAVLLLALMFPTLIIWVAHAVAAIALWGAFITSAALLSGFAFIWFFLAFCHLVYFALAKQRIPDLNLILIAAVAVITRRKGVLIVAYAGAILQAGLFVMWGYIWVTVNGRLTWAIDVLCFLLFFWVSQLCKYAGHTIIAGSTASWYFGKTETRCTLNSALRVFTTSLGSVVYGSVMMALFKAIRVISSAIRVSGTLLEALCGTCLLALEAVMRMFNIYGFVLVAMYGYSFNHAASRAYKLLVENNMRGMMLDDVVAITVVVGGCGMGAIGVAACWVGLRLGLANGYQDYDFTVTLFIPSFVLGLMVGFVVLEVLESIVTTIYTCFAEEPRVLATTDRTLYQELKEQWYAGMEDSDSDEHEHDEENDSDQHSISSGFSDEDLPGQESESDEEEEQERTGVAVATMVAHTKGARKQKRNTARRSSTEGGVGLGSTYEGDAEMGLVTVPIPGAIPVDATDRAREDSPK